MRFSGKVISQCSVKQPWKKTSIQHLKNNKKVFLPQDLNKQPIDYWSNAVFPVTLRLVGECPNYL